jgi:D-amino-acid dehydrogenase
MRILILGAGVAGVTATWRLLEDGHEVTVVDRHAEAASETSFANAGLIAPGHAFAWASPRAPGILLRSLFRDGQPLRFRLSADPALWRWSIRFLRECTAERARTNTLRKHRLCLYAQAALKQVAADTGIAYDAASGGLLYLYRSQESLDRGVANMQLLAEDGQQLEVIDRERAAKLDPALEPTKGKIAGAVFCPTDESGDACVFTRELARLCAERGAHFLYATTIDGIVTNGDRIEKVATGKGDLSADLYVLSLGSYSSKFEKQVGERVPVYPVKGYSVTIPVDGANNPPTLGGVDEDNLFAYARLGDRVRLTAVAEFSGYDTSHRPSDFSSMLSAARDLFPGAGDYTRPQYWACLRPMTPKGAPILGRGRHRNLYYNAGHGHMGWTMACGTARITADLIAGREPELPLDGMTLRTA